MRTVLFFLFAMGCSPDLADTGAPLTLEARGLRAELVDGIVIRRGATELSLRTRAVGGRPLGYVAPEACGTAEACAQLDHGEVVEWFRATPKGIEQGWTVASAPAELELVVGFEGTVGAVDADARGATLVARDGSRWRYDGLAAWDARGEIVPASMTERDDEIVVTVDTRGATFPITVDPTIGDTYDTFTASDVTGNYFGYDGAIVGDVDADGYDDVVVGAPLDDDGGSNYGALYLYYGSSSGVDTSTETKLEGAGGAPDLGWSVSGAGDIDGDGYDEIVGNAYGGGATVYYSDYGTLSVTDVDTVAPCSVYASSAAGDVNDDGFGDLVVGCYLYQPSGYYERGAAYLYLGSATGLSATGTDLSPTSGLSSYDHLGSSLSKAGDTNGDGYDDVIVGAQAYTSTFTSSAGKAYVYYGGSSGASASSYTRLTASDGATGDEFGFDVSGGGDVDGDGYDDVIVGAVLDSVGSNSNQGSAYVLYGTSGGVSNASQDKITTSDGARADFCGYRVAMGDFDADGFADVAVSCPADDDSASASGAVYAYFGSTSGVSLTSQDKFYASGLTAGSYFGEGGLSAFGDVDGDGAADLLVSGYRTSRASLFYGVGEDDDGDGWFEVEDCDDADADTYPGAAALDSTTACMTDADGDGYGDATPASGVTAGDDCNDGSASTYPGALETVGDQLDQSCDGQETCYIDADGDGTTSRSGTVVSSDTDCADPGEASSSATVGECDDYDANTFPGAASRESATACMTDADGDNYGDDSPAAGVVAGGDCDDSSAAFSPGATEGVGDGIDQDCDDHERCYADDDLDGYTDGTAVTSTDLDCVDTGEGSRTMPTGDCDDGVATTRPGAAPNDSSTACLADADGDDYGDSTPSAGITAGSDCDDGDPAISPAATERTGDGVDQDCDGTETCYVDFDLDGYTTGGETVSADEDCTDSGEATSTTPTGDCVDTDRRTHPGVASADSTSACMTDQDSDGYGDDTPAAGVTAGTDCDDASSGRNPGASEDVGNNIDEDCDGGALCYADADLDGYTDRGSVVVSADEDCQDAGEADTSTRTGECNDADAAVHPGTYEGIGDEIDGNCDGVEYCYSDADGDGYTDGSSTYSADYDCRDAGEALSTAGTGDCDDGDATRRPGLPELVGDGIDQDCDRLEVCLVDADGDGYTDGSSTVVSRDSDCADAGEGSSSDPVGECDDANPAIHPGVTEVAGDEVDADCDGLETCLLDADSDGYTDGVATIVSADIDCGGATEASTSTPTGECDDTDAAVHPGAEEVTGDGVDQDCDAGEVCFTDTDGDGFTDGETTVASADADCADTGEAPFDAPTGDCDDATADVHPGAEDAWYDGVDADCDDADDYDADGDGHASDAYGGDDCADDDAGRGPQAEELPGDELDSDCDGGELCFQDADLDHYPDTETVVSADTDCTDLGETTNALATDCDDEDEGVHPGASEVPGDAVDQDCDGADGEGASDTGGDSSADKDDTGDPGCGGCATSTADVGAPMLLAGLAFFLQRRRRSSVAVRDAGGVPSNDGDR